MIKALLLDICLTAGTAAAFAQGTVLFDTYNSDPAFGMVFQPHSTTPLPPGFVGQIWYSDVSSTAPLSASGPPIGFSASMLGYIQDGTVIFPGDVPGTTVYLQLRVWNIGAGAAWEIALGSPALVAKGISAITPCVLGGTDSHGTVFDPQQFNNFASFSALWADEPLPEPGMAGLVGVGFVTLLVFGRRNG